MTNTKLLTSVDLIMKNARIDLINSDFSKRFQLTIAIYFLLSFLLISCVNEKDFSPIDKSISPNTQIQLLFTDSIWVYSDSIFKIVSIQLNGNLPPDSVLMSVQSDSMFYSFHLYDDGGFNSSQDSSISWLSRNSGDVIPNDNIWSCRIAFGLLPVSTYRIEFNSFQNNQPLRITRNWQIVYNLPPVLTSILAPDSLYSGIDTSMIVTTFDPDTIINSGIHSVSAKFYQLPSYQFMNIGNFSSISGHQSWRLLLPFSFASGKSTGNYRCVITSQDVLGSQISDSVHFWLENLPPICDSIFLTGTSVGGQTIVYFDSTGTDTVRFQFFVKWDDPQSETDLRSMRLRMYRNLTADTVIYDTTLIEGTGFDTIPLDGRFIMPFQLDNRNRPTNPNYRRPPFDQYRIQFTAFDGGLNFSSDTTFHFQILQSPSFLSKPDQSYREKFTLNSRNPF